VERQRAIALCSTWSCHTRVRGCLLDGGG
jgi:hypothetical protein